MKNNSNKASRDDLCIFESSLRTGFSNSAQSSATAGLVCGRGDFERGVAPLFIEGLKYHTTTEPRQKTIEEMKLDYHTSMTSKKILLENLKALHPRLTEDTIEGLAFLSVHPLLTEEERQKYKTKLYEKSKEEEECQAQELSQTRKSCQSPVNLPQSNSTTLSSPMSDII